MTFKEAEKTALKNSLEGYVQHVNASLFKTSSGATVDPEGYYVSDWENGTTVVSYEKGMRL